MKTTIALMIVMMVSTIVYSQTPVDNAALPWRQAERMKEVLELNDAQYASIKGINERYAERRRELKTKTESRESGRDEWSALRDQRKKEIQSVLTPEQSQKWESHIAEKKAERRKTKSGYSKNYYKDHLSLTDEQDKRLRDANIEYRKKMKESAGNAEAQKELKENHAAVIKSILTPEQYQKMTELKKERHEQKDKRKGERGGKKEPSKKR